MSDARLRELERRWRSSRSLVDQQAYLLERLRIGELTEERFLRLLLAGHLEHGPAQPAPGPLTWTEGLIGFGRSLLNWEISFTTDPTHVGQVFEGDAWASLQEVRASQKELAQGLGAAWIHTGQEALIRAGFACLHRALDGLVPDRSERVYLQEVDLAFVSDALPGEWFVTYERTFPLGGLGFVTPRAEGNRYPWLGFVDRAIELLGAAEVQRVIVADLLPWVLETGDPLRDRVEARPVPPDAGGW